MLQSEEHIYGTAGPLELKASVWKTHEKEAAGTLLYFHGGGLVYGERNDLPEEYLALFLEAGYNFISFDYPLAPESKLPDIYAAAKQAVKWFDEEAIGTLNFSSSSFSLFGRSAGAYLCFLLTADDSLPKPEHLIDFYGYDSLTYPAFSQPNAHYLKHPAMPEALINRMIQPQPIAHGPLQTRYALYLYARQTGKWMEFLGAGQQEAKKRFSVKQDDFNSFPPVFIAHSTADQDVPYSVAERLNESLPETVLHTVQGEEHDFDRDPEKQKAKDAYRALLDWLKSAAQ